jgi:hypothetical protein
MKEYVSQCSKDADHATELPKDNDLVTSEASPPEIVDEPESEEETIHSGRITGLKIDTKTEITEAESPPDSPFKIKCRCGLEGDGNVYYDENEGEAVLCTECECWSHIACQTNGRASKLRAKDAFFCDFCQVRVPGMGHLDKYRASERRCAIIILISFCRLA